MDARSLVRTLLTTPGYRYTFALRACDVLTRGRGRAARIAALLVLRRFERRWGISIPITTEIGEGFYIGHYGGIVVHPAVRIGRNCNISQGVTLGHANRGRRAGVPVIGDGVYIGPGAKVMGAVTVGRNVAIGANCVVTDDVPDNAVVVGVPGRVVSEGRGAAGYVNRTEPTASQLEILHEERVLVGRALVRSPIAIEVDHRVVAQRLDEHRLPARSQDPCDLAIRSVEIDMVEHPRPGHQVEGVGPEVERLPVSDAEVDSLGDPQRFGPRASLLDSHRREVHRRHAVTLPSEMKRGERLGAAPVIESIGWRSTSGQPGEVRLERPVDGGVVEAIGRALIVREPPVVERALPLVASSVGCRHGPKVTADRGGEDHARQPSTPAPGPSSCLAADAVRSASALVA